jgi:thioredoxin-like negative regulator of GroEL
MRFRPWRILPLLLLNLTAASSIVAQAGPETAYQAERQKADDLFSEGKRLEALPLLEELVKTHPKDDQMVVALAACLVEHAATLSDEQAAGKERLRARDLLDKAWDLGNTSPLAMNLSQLLRQLPESGAIKFSDNPQIDQVLRAGEAAFSQRDFADALKYYAKALELEPANYTATLFTGNTYDKQNETAAAAEWYERTIQLDPNVETAYRYYADMLAREGNMAKARAMLIHAAVAEPYNRIVWRELHAWATLNDTQINEVFVAVPSLPSGSTLTQLPPDVSIAWQAYRAVQANWQKGDAFKKHFPDEKAYRHSLPEESEALTAAAKVLEKSREEKKTAGLPVDDPNSSLLLKLYEADLIDAYVLFSLGDAGIARDYAAYRANNRDKLEEFMNKFVVAPAHSQTSISVNPDSY